MVGVPVASLRAWQRRYGIVNPVRSGGNYRLYDDADIALLRRMHALVMAGWSPKEAADAVLHEGLGPPIEFPQRQLDLPQALPSRTDPDATDLVRAAASLDSFAAGRLLDERLAAGSFEYVVDTWLLPELDHLGDAWAAGTVSVAGEHLVAAAVQRRLNAAFDAAAQDAARPPRVLTGLPPGCRHELGILAFATAARRRGLAVVHLGPDLPVADWVIAVERHQPAAVVLAVPTSDDVAPAVEIARSVGGANVFVGLGGGHQAAAAEPLGQLPGGLAEALGHSIGDAAAMLETRLRRL
jgi:DNA-binding transcriptional MerR regulator